VSRHGRLAGRGMYVPVPTEESSWCGPAPRATSAMEQQMSCGDLLIEEMSSQVVNLGCKIQHYVTAVMYCM
jgi:hypothetical protein